MTPPLDIAAIRARLDADCDNVDVRADWQEDRDDLRAALDEVERLRECVGIVDVAMGPSVGADAAMSLIGGALRDLGKAYGAKP